MKGGKRKLVGRGKELSYQGAVFAQNFGNLIPGVENAPKNAIKPGKSVRLPSRVT